ncbi:MAG: acetyltransferase, partial [bacterium]
GRPDSPGFKVTSNLLHGGYEGQIHLVNPRYKTILGTTCFPSVKSLGTVPDLAIVITPSRLLRKSLAQCASAGIQVAMVMSGSDESTWLRDYTTKLGIRLIGPYSTGLIRPSLKLNISYTETTSTQGSLALVSQSTSLGTAMLDWAQTTNVGFSAVLLTGNDTDISLSDLIDLLAEDGRTRAIIIYVERVKETRGFLSALSAAARIKPVVLMRSTKEGAHYCDAITRTGRVFSSDNVFQTALNRAGVVRIRTFQNLLAAAKILSTPLRVSGNRLAIVSNGAAPAMMAIERMDIKQFQIPTLTEDFLRSLNKKLNNSVTGSNPIVLRKPAQLADHYASAIEALQHLDDIDAILVIFVPDSRNEPMQIMQSLLQFLPSKKPILGCWMGGVSVIEARNEMTQAGIPSFRTPEAAVDGFDFLHRHFFSQQQLLQLPNPTSRNTRADVQAAKTLVESALHEGHRILSNDQACQLLRLLDIPVQTTDVDASTDNDKQTLSGKRLVLSIFKDATFGPTISLGIAGHLSAAISQRAVQLPPLNRFLIEELLQYSDTRIYMGWSRKDTSVEKESVAHILRRLSELACEVPDLFSLEINLLIVASTGAVTTNVHIALERSKATKLYGHLAIHPYPWHWIRATKLKNGAPVQLRPIRPEDAESIIALVKEMSPESRYFRFMHAINELSPQMVAQFTKLDYDRQMALVATDDEEDIIGVSRYVISSDRQTGEFAISISEQWKGLGLASALMRLLLVNAKTQGLQSLQGDVLMSNRPMQALMTSLGFSTIKNAGYPEVRRYQYLLHE